MIRLAVIVLALIAAFAPLPAPWIEHWYSQTLYPAIQTAVTPATNRVPVALLDVAIAVLLVMAILWFLKRLRRAGLPAAVIGGVARALVLAAVVYLLFLAVWGFNYRRLPLQEKLDYSESRVTEDAARSLARQTVERLNAGYAGKQKGPAPGPPLEEAFAETQRLLGSGWSAAPGLPKRSFLGLYFRRAAIDGMTNPFFLEIILNPDVLPVERPFVLAHEWAHLAGYANEAEANFVAWLTCVRGDIVAQYSGWISMYGQILAAVPQRDRAEIAARLQGGPRQDLAAMEARYRASSPVVRAAAREAYDAYLRANRVDAGIDSYDLVVQLALGTSFADGWAPRLRR